MNLRRITLGLFVFLLLVVGVSLPSLASFPYSFLVAAAGAVIVSLFPERLRDLIVGKEQPTVSVEPLQVLRFGPGANLERSQWINMAWTHFPPGGQHTLTALFGIIRVHAIKGDALDCQAAVRIKMQDQWVESGYLNWYSPTLIRNLTSLADFQIIDLNRYLTNTSEHISRGDSKDLVAFYLVDGMQSVSLCSDMTHPFAGNIQNDQPLQFQIEVTLTAQHEPKVVNVFDIEAAWGRLLISKATTDKAATVNLDKPNPGPSRRRNLYYDVLTSGLGLTLAVFGFYAIFSEGMLTMQNLGSVANVMIGLITVDGLLLGLTAKGHQSRVDHDAEAGQIMVLTFSLLSCLVTMLLASFSTDVGSVRSFFFVSILAFYFAVALYSFPAILSRKNPSESQSMSPRTLQHK
jgi:hypothetical protein